MLPENALEPVQANSDRIVNADHLGTEAKDSIGFEELEQQFHAPTRVQTNDLVLENSGQSETSTIPVQSNQSTGSTLSDLQPAESSSQSSNQDEQNQGTFEDEEEDKPPRSLWSLWLRIAITAGDLPTTRSALNTLVRTHGLQRILSKAEIQSIPYIGGRRRIMSMYRRIMSMHY